MRMISREVGYTLTNEGVYFEFVVFNLNVRICTHNYRTYDY